MESSPVNDWAGLGTTALQSSGGHDKREGSQKSISNYAANIVVLYRWKYLHFGTM